MSFNLHLIVEFSQIALLLVVAAGFGIVARALKQPLLVGYLFAGLILSVFGMVRNVEVASGLGQIGVTLLLFLVGLEMKLTDLKSIGKVALLTGVGQIIFTSAMGLFLARILGFGILPSVYIALALTFSSTIIGVKLLGAKNALDGLYGKIVIGFLLVQDLVAILILMFLSGMSRGDFGVVDYFAIVFKGGALLLSVWFLSKKILPMIFEKFIALSDELLFIASIAWALGLASLVAGPLGFTLEVGGFLAGLALSNLPEHLTIAAKTRGLRDFFLTIFFMALGTKLVVGPVGSIFLPALGLSLFVLVAKPLIVLAMMGGLGYKKRTGFLTGLTVAQISEFSLILVAMGATLEHVDESVVALVILVGVITMTLSTYMVGGAEKIYKLVSHLLSIFERSNTREAALTVEREMRDHIIMVGCDRTGRALLPFLMRRAPVLVIDFNPKVFETLTANKTPVLFGDVNEPEIMDIAKLRWARLVISTISNGQDNLKLLELIKSKKASIKVIMAAATRKEAIRLYEKGADLVVVPEMIAGEYMRHILKTYGMGDKIDKIGKSHFMRLIGK